MGDWRKSTLHMKVPASKRCTPVTLSADTEEDPTAAAARRKWARSPNAVGSDHRSGRPLCDAGDLEPKEAASRSLCRRES